MIDILAGLSWTSHPHISMSSTEQSIQHHSVISVRQNSNQDPESRLMSIIDELCNQQGTQPYIDIKFSVCILFFNTLYIYIYFFIFISASPYIRVYMGAMCCAPYHFTCATLQLIKHCTCYQGICNTK